MNGLIGVNTRTIGVSRDQIMRAAKQIGSAWILCQNDPDLVREANAAGFKTIYRQSGDENMSLDPVQFVRTRAEKGATLAHGTNEIKSGPELHAYTDELLKVGSPLAIYNYGTHAPRADWEASFNNIKYAVSHGSAIGVHFYPDKVHDADLKHWLDIKREVGGLWIVTEFGYIRDYQDPHKGWRGVMGPQERAAFLDTWVPFFNTEKIPICTFCYDPWDQPTVEKAKAEGFGFWDYPDVISKMTSLNKVYTWSEKPVTTPPAIQIPPLLGDSLQATVTATAGLNMRTTPSVKSPVLRTLPYHAAVTEYPANTVIEGVNTFIFIHDAADNPGWVSQTYLAPVEKPLFTLKLPFKDYLLTSRFNTARDYPFAPDKIQRHEGQDGVDDLARQYGSDPMVHAGAAGKVVKVGFDAKGYGNYLILDFGNDYRAWYAHFEAIYAKEGQSVKELQILGLMGSTGGTSTAPHCHLTLQWIGHGLDNYVVTDVIDPAPYLVSW